MRRLCALTLANFRKGIAPYRIFVKHFELILYHLNNFQELVQLEAAHEKRNKDTDNFL
jgi:hypothetical protein